MNQYRTNALFAFHAYLRYNWVQHNVKVKEIMAKSKKKAPTLIIGLCAFMAFIVGMAVGALSGIAFAVGTACYYICMPIYALLINHTLQRQYRPYLYLIQFKDIFLFSLAAPFWIPLAAYVIPVSMVMVTESLVTRTIHSMHGHVKKPSPYKEHYYLPGSSVWVCFKALLFGSLSFILGCAVGCVLIPATLLVFFAMLPFFPIFNNYVIGRFGKPPMWLKIPITILMFILTPVALVGATPFVVAYYVADVAVQYMLGGQWIPSKNPKKITITIENSKKGYHLPHSKKEDLMKEKKRGIYFRPGIFSRYGRIVIKNPNIEKSSPSSNTLFTKLWCNVQEIQTMFSAINNDDHFFTLKVLRVLSPHKTESWCYKGVKALLCHRYPQWKSSIDNIEKKDIKKLHTEILPKIREQLQPHIDTLNNLREDPAALSSEQLDTKIRKVRETFESCKQLIPETKMALIDSTLTTQYNTIQSKKNALTRLFEFEPILENMCSDFSNETHIKNNEL